MTEVSVRELRNHGGDVLDRVEAGERLIVTRNGKPVAELVPIPRRDLALDEILRRARTLPPIDPDELRADIDAVLDTRLFIDDE
jgi:prevent-host-death family protein